MDLQEKLELIEEALDVEEGSLTAETVLVELEDWDSMAVLSIISLLKTRLGKKTSLSQIESLQTVQDICNLMD